MAIVEASLATRHMHTRHGLHLRNEGKKWLAKKIYKAAQVLQTKPTENLRTFKDFVETLILLQSPNVELRRQDEKVLWVFKLAKSEGDREDLGPFKSWKCKKKRSN